MATYGPSYYGGAKKSAVTSMSRKDSARNRQTRGDPKFNSGKLAAAAKKSGSLGYVGR